MPTALEATKEIQDKVFAGIETGQKAVLDVVQTWAETVESTFSKLPDLAFADPAKPSELLETTFSFTERAIKSNREFASKVFEVLLPATRAATAGPRSAAAQGAQAAQAAKVTSPRP